jgi:ATP-dependent Clp protease adapter protein ClpS
MNMQDIKSRFDTSLIRRTSTKESSGDSEDDFVRIYVHDAPIDAFYIHFVLIDCFENIDSEMAPMIVSFVHHHGKALLPPGRCSKKEAEASLKKVKKRNEQSGNNLIFTIEEI